MTKIQAHRGACSERPENTMAAFRRAIELHADGIETDVALLADGSLIIHHDDKFGRTVPGLSGSIYDHTFEEIRKHSAGAYYSEKYKDEKVPTLEELLELMQGNSMILNVELKTAQGFINGVEDRVVELLRQYHMEDRCIISSFHHPYLANIKKRYPQIPVGALYYSTLGWKIPDLADYAAANHFDALHAWYLLVNEELVEKAHRMGIAVNVWTPDEEADIDRMLDLGVDTIITDDAALGMKLRDASENK